MVKFEKAQLKFFIAFILFALAIVRLFWFDEIGNRMDYTFIILVVLGALIPFISWEKLTSLKAGAGGIELSLDRPEVKGALKSFEPDTEDILKRFEGIENIGEEFSKQLHRRLSGLSEELEQFRGCRILWIDDCPHKIIGERRLFRSLGAEVITASTSKTAREQIERDNDFDVIITDVGRNEKPTEINGIKYHVEGVDFILELKKDTDSVIRSMPVVFYSGLKDWNTLVKLTQPARDLSPDIEICNNLDMLISKTIPLVAKTRLNPTTVPPKKQTLV